MRRVPRLFRGSERDVCVFGGQQVAQRVRAFIVRATVSAALVEPMFEMLARGGGEFREEKSGAALVAGPHDVGVSLERNVGAREYAAKGEIRTHGHGLGGLNCETVLANVDAESGKRSGFEVEIDQGF